MPPTPGTDYSKFMWAILLAFLTLTFIAREEL
jgi:hypothetical protein